MSAHIKNTLPIILISLLALFFVESVVAAPMEELAAKHLAQQFNRLRDDDVKAYYISHTSVEMDGYSKVMVKLILTSQGLGKEVPVVIYVKSVGDMWISDRRLSSLLEREQKFLGEKVRMEAAKLAKRMEADRLLIKALNEQKGK